MTPTFRVRRRASASISRPTAGLLVLGTALAVLLCAAPARAWRLDAPWHGDGRDVVKAGAARRDLTPELGRERVFLAGYQPGRPAERVADPLWFRVLVLEVNGVRVALGVFDLVGYFRPEIEKIRAALPAHARIAHLTITSTHTHSGPDSMGLWGPTLGKTEVPWRTGRNAAYMERLRTAAREAVVEAAAALVPVRLTAWARPTGRAGFVRDSRRPHVIDDLLTLVRFDHAETGAAVATLVNWSNHPETLPGSSHLVSSDFPHFLRTALETGLSRPTLGADGAPARQEFPGLGGVCLYFSGSVGGLMTPLDEPVPDPATGRLHAADDYPKTRLLGENLAAFCFDLMATPGTPIAPRLSGRGRGVRIPIGNRNFVLAALLGLMDRPWKALATGVETEVGVLRVGELTLLTVPGELYPEIAIGGIETPAGADFPHPPEEVPPLKVLAGGRFPMVLGMANDMLGYLIPHSEWDAQAPFLYDAESSPYGEENSVGPEAGRRVYRALAGLLRDE